MTETTTTNGNSIWKFATASLLSMVITLVGAYFASSKDAVTKQDLGQALATQQRQLDDQSRQIGEMRQSIIQLDVDTGRIAEHLGVTAKPGVSH